MYKIVGADQKEYGPVDAEQIRQWIREGRANARTITRLEDGPWKPLSTFPEFAADLPVESPLTPPLASTVPPLSTSAAPMSTEANTMAIAGLVCGGLSLLGALPMFFNPLPFITCCCPILPLLGLIFSAIGLSQINREPQRYNTSRTIAITGLVVSGLAMLTSIVPIILAIVAGSLAAFRFNF